MAYSFKGEMFEKFPVPSIGWNTFDLSHQNNFTTDWGRLTPIFCEPNLPGEIWKMSIALFVRMMTLVVPIMHQIDCFVHAFHVRNPILWRNWRDFIRGGTDGRTDIAPPNMFLSQKDVSEVLEDIHEWYKPGSLLDYLGYPLIDTDALDQFIDGGNDYFEFSNTKYVIPYDILPLKAYQSIWNEYYMDEFIDEDLKVDLLEDFDGDYLDNYINHDGIDLSQIADLHTLRYRRWEKDAFTSALQKPIAVPDVKIPFSADVNIVGANRDLAGESNFIYYGDAIPSGYTPTMQVPENTSDHEPFEPLANFGDGGGIVGIQTTIPGVNIAAALSAEISNVSATINQLRANVAMQEWYELSARAGNRYKEMLVAHFNTVVPDYTLDRPQYLGGTRFTIGISQVLQTSASQGNQGDTDFQPLGQMAGQGMSGAGDFLFKEKFYEHGWVMLIFSIRPRSMYTDYMPRKYQKFDRREYFWNKLANVGDQEVYNREVFCKQFSNYRVGSDNDIIPINGYDPDGTFGYQTRYWEYKYLPNSIHGDFRTTLKDWHLGRFFESQPNLNSQFLEVKGRQLNRIFAYEGDDYDHFVCQANIDCKVTRPIPIFSIPKFS